MSAMHYGLGFFDHETGKVECADNPFEAKHYPGRPLDPRVRELIHFPSP